MIPVTVVRTKDVINTTARGIDVKVYLNIFNCFPLQSQSKQYGTLYCRRSYILTEARPEIQRGNHRHQIQDDMIIQLVIRVGLKTPKVKR